jgi:hypothetical protein
MLRSKNKELMDDVKKYIAMEKTKIDEDRKQKSIQKKIQKDKEDTHTQERRTGSIKVGSLVRLANTKQTGTLLELEKGQAVVAIGVFRTKVEVAKLEFIQ